MTTTAATKTSLTGIKPTGKPHLGNLLGAIEPALELAERFHGFYFIADYHALTTMRDPKELRESVYDVTATWLACGLDPERTHVYRQSSVIEVFELSWILGCWLATGQLERGHAYKDAIDKGNASPNAGIFNYPVLMAADILLYDCDVVPIGKDQLQHLEVARDVATRINHHYGEGTVVVPEAHLSAAPVVPGLDGQKMSKSKDNVIPLFAPAKELRKTVMKIVTGSETLEEPKTPEGTVFELFKLVASPGDVETLAGKLRAGGYGWGHAKQDLYEALEAKLGPMRERYAALRGDTAELDRVLDAGAEKVRPIARRTVARVRRAIGID